MKFLFLVTKTDIRLSLTQQIVNHFGVLEFFLSSELIISFFFTIILRFVSKP